MGAGNELDCYLDAIVRSSMGVANSCDGRRRECIVQACQSVSDNTRRTDDKWIVGHFLMQLLELNLLEQS